MLSLIYRVSLFVGAIANLLMATGLLAHQKAYTRFPSYHRARLITAIWLIVFAAGYILHATLGLRESWPAAASALTVSYFHFGAIAFCWGYIPLLNPNYLTRKIIVRDLIIYGVGLISYWTVALIWRDNPLYTVLSFSVFFLYVAYHIILFYRTYHNVSYRLMKMSYGNVSGFVRWLQVSCDLIIFFGTVGVIMLALFQHDTKFPFTVLTLLGIVIWAYIVFSLNKYGSVVETASRATENIAAIDL